jgi:hypothetical protein
MLASLHQQSSVQGKQPGVCVHTQQVLQRGLGMAQSTWLHACDNCQWDSYASALQWCSSRMHAIQAQWQHALQQEEQANTALLAAHEQQQQVYEQQLQLHRDQAAAREAALAAYQQQYELAVQQAEAANKRLRELHAQEVAGRLQRLEQHQQVGGLRGAGMRELPASSCMWNALLHDVAPASP